MPTFLTRDQVYRMIQRELPEDVYPDGPPSAFFSTADSYAAASGAASGYTSLQTIYDNYFPKHAVERLDAWEITAFGEVASAASGSLSVSQRQDRIIAKLRERKDLSVWTMLTTILDVLPDGTFVQAFENCSIEQGWILGESRLGFDTRLGNFSKIIFNDVSSYCDPPYDCFVLGANRLGETTALCPSVLNDGDTLNGFEWSIQQFMAYSFEVRVFGALTTIQRSEILSIIKRLKPSRSVGMLADNLVLADFFLTIDAGDVDRIDNVNCVAKDAASSTGYIGRLIDDS